MTYIMFVLLLALVLGLIAVASNPSPYFAALGLVVVAGAGCGILVGSGGSFLSLILFLIYLGGMLVVFAYSSALAAEPYPETLGSRSVAIYVGSYLLAVVGGSVSLVGEWYEGSWVPCGEMSTGGVIHSDMGGVGMIYSEGGWMLVVSAWMLLLCLFVVLELTRGVSRGTLRVV
uniref:NADH-ubiquinone oxidoreductase chain 6 n=1 Tax=Pegasus volitans TaxID=215342 RepID=A7E1F1_9TELE|nr:NADH dehydrogenase subunit 6 [Pegasus volitans]BAF74962.1 NADH dehydrogenase subunit 6 [Pegasus volitans]